ncbi:MAG TPA: hypothetical protein VGK40_10710 [Verrucomicrobiae bacterium]|jgi:hypothetical protein
MSKHTKKDRHALAPPAQNASKRRGPVGWLIALAAVAAAVVVGATLRNGQERPIAPVTKPAPATATNLPTLEINKAVMVTVELDFGGKPPGIAQALRDIERRYQPDDGAGRTFAILDAYGETTPEGKLHLSMHVSTEKPGIGALAFKRTGAMLWESRIIPPTNANARAFTGKDLLILVDQGEGNGKLLTVDGSSSPVSVLKANVKELGLPLETIWPDGTEREVTFIYSACGCPVKVMTRREGNRTVRAKDLPVIFPDDPAAVQVITALMGWK